jgi:putative ABC transport system permease protein
VDTLMQDIRYSWRVLVRSPGFTAVAIVTLALGIGANTSIFSLVDGILLRPLPYRDAGRIVHLSWQGEQLHSSLTTPQFEFCRDHCQTFTAIAGVRDHDDKQLDLGSGKQWVRTLSITDGFFETLGVSFKIGRPFDRAETRPGAPFAAVLTDELWRRDYRADPAVVGRQILLDGQTYTVAGVLPSGFQFAEPADVFVSAHLANEVADQGSNTDVIGRLKPGVTLSEAEAEGRVMGAAFIEEGPKSPGQEHMGLFRPDPYQSWLGSNHRQSLLILLSAVGLLLLIACANVASLLLARANARQREISVRLALGASRARLLAQLLTESLLLGVAGAVAGLAIGVILLHSFLSAIPWTLPAVDQVGIDGRVLLFTVLIALATGVGFGFSSFFQISQLQLSRTLTRGRTTAGASRDRGRFLHLLVVGEVAIALMLAVGAGLLVESLHILSQERLGFNPNNLVVMETPFAPGTPAAAKPWEFERQALERVVAVPGVRAAAVVSVAPLHGQNNFPVQRDGHPENSIGATEIRPISSQYFSAMEIPVLRGRSFDEADFAPSTSVVVISEALARAWWGDQDPVGDHLVVGEVNGQLLTPNARPLEIVGVVGDVKGMRVSQPVRPTVYVPASSEDMTGSATDFVVRTSTMAGMAPALRQAILEVAPDQRIVDLEPMTQLVSVSVAQPNFEAILMSAFGGLALTLTLVGVYGVLNFQVSQRTHEMGVRIALGAGRRDVLGLIIGQAALLAGLGVVIGASAAWGLTRFMASQLYEVKPTDPAIFAGVGTLVLFVAILAAYLPARRALHIDPIIAVREG